MHHKNDKDAQGAHIKFQEDNRRKTQVICVFKAGFLMTFLNALMGFFAIGKPRCGVVDRERSVGQTISLYS